MSMNNIKLMSNIFINEDFLLCQTSYYDRDSSEQSQGWAAHNAEAQIWPVLELAPTSS